MTAGRRFSLMQFLTKIASRDGVNPLYIQRVARRAKHSYKFYTIPKANGARRNIYQPSKELKSVQRWLITRFLLSLTVHHSATAYNKGCSTKKNAAKHKDNRFLLRIDFKDFFESLTTSDFFNKMSLLKDNFQPALDGEDIEILSQIFFRGPNMTIGAPSSPFLSNILMYDFDRQLNDYCSHKDVAYTRYADDLFFSTKQYNTLKHIEQYVHKFVKVINMPSHLTINTEKTRHTSKKGKRSITGLVITENGNISVGRAKKREIKSIVNQALSDNLQDDQIDKLRGLLAYVHDVEPSFLLSLKNKYGETNIVKIMSREDTTEI